MHQRNIAGKHVRQLRQEQGRAQIAHQAFVEERAWLLRLAHAGEDGGIDRDVAFAAEAATIMSVWSSNSALPAMPASASANPAA